MAKMPGNYQWMMETFSEVMTAHQEFGKTIQAAGPLDLKTSELVKLAAAAAVHSEGAVHSHTRRARQAGASPEEIQHALVSLISTIGFPTVTAALSWAREALE